jgi:drug/metabolite transporter (DMT)-like permease
LTAYTLALLSALCYGAADFVGGLTARRVSTIAAVLLAQSSGLVILAAAMPLLPPASPVTADLVWGVIAGVMGSVGVALLYGALAVGTMAVVAPITAVCAVAIPVMAGVLLGERLAPMTAAGILLARAAVVLVSQQPPTSGEATVGGASSPDAAPGGQAQAAAADPRPLLAPGVLEALLAGVAIGLFFLALARTAPAAGMWPLVAARGVSVAMFGGLALLRRSPVRAPAPALVLACGGGALDMLANALYLIATRYGPFSSVVTLASLYPASTVVLARVVLGERLSRVQIAGIACALVAIVLIVGW